jgi:uncharacterized RDD family membrane protein YckC
MARLAGRGRPAIFELRQERTLSRRHDLPDVPVRVLAAVYGRRRWPLALSIWLLAGYIMVLFDDRRRGLHDRIARTVVIDAPETETPVRR